MTNLKSKVIVFGMDGATWNVLTPLIEQGKLPNLKKLRNSGSWGKLNSTIPPLTPPGWTTAFTGKNPGKHNIFDFCKPDQNDYEMHLTSNLDRKTRAVWNAVSEAGGKVLAMNVAHTFPPEKVDGVIISGFGTPETDCDYSSPKELKEKILKKHPTFHPGIPTSFIEKNDWSEFIKKLEEHTKTNFQVFCELYEEMSPDLSIYVFDEMDRLMHFFWHYFDKNHPNYEENQFSNDFIQHFELVDKLIGKFLEKLSPETYIISFSDHGFGTVHSDIFLNNYLLEKNYIKIKEGKNAEIKITPILKIKSAVIKLLEKIGLWKYYRNFRLKQISVGTVWFLGNIDWNNTKAVMHSMAGRSVHLNIKGRNPQGFIEPDEVETLTDQLKKDLLELRHPKTGELLITNVWSGKEAYSGEFLENAPDLILEPAPGFSFHHGFADEIVKPSTQHGRLRSGDHEQFGTFIAKGPGITKIELKKISLPDIATLILHLLGLPISNDMDGKLQNEIFEKNWIADHPATYEKEKLWVSESMTTNAEEEQQIADQLRALGYL